MRSLFFLESAKNESDKIRINNAFEDIVKLYLIRNNNNLRRDSIIITKDDSNQKEENDNKCVEIRKKVNYRSKNK